MRVNNLFCNPKERIPGFLVTSRSKLDFLLQQTEVWVVAHQSQHCVKTVQIMSEVGTIVWLCTRKTDSLQ